MTLSVTRAALYVRVSTREQTTGPQKLELRRWAERLGLEIVKVYADSASGARSDRAALMGVLGSAHRRECDVLLIWSLDRLNFARGMGGQEPRTQEIIPRTTRHLCRKAYGGGVTSSYARRGARSQTRSRRLGLAVRRVARSALSRVAEKRPFGHGAQTTSQTPLILRGSATCPVGGFGPPRHSVPGCPG